MAKTPEVLNTNDPASVLGLLGTSKVSEQLADLLLKRLLKQQETEDEELRLKQAAHKAGMDAMVIRREMELANQKSCPHKKPYGESALVGQRLHSHKYLYLCQYCSKEWFDGEVPLDLRISSNIVGGPNV